MLRSRKLLSQSRRGANSSVPGLLQCNDLIVTENPKKEKKKSFDYKPEQFMACILLLIHSDAACF